MRKIVVSTLVVVFLSLAVSAAGVLDGISVVAWVKYADMDDEWDNMEFILDMEGAQITETETTDAGALQGLLDEADVFLIPEQEGASTSTLLEDVGETLAQTLFQFLQERGRIVSCAGGSDGGEYILRGAGITIAGSEDFWSPPELEVVTPSDPLMVEPFKIPSPFSGSEGTAYFPRVDTDAEILVCDSDGDAVVFRLAREGGEVVLLGFDYHEYNDATENLLINACCYKRILIPCNSHISTTGTLPPLSGTYDEEICFKFPRVATLLGIAVEGEVNLYFRYASPISFAGDSFDYSFVSSGEQEIAISSEAFRSGRWFVAIDNAQAQAQSYKLTVLPVPTLIDIEDASDFSTSAKVEATPVSSVNRYLQTSQGMLCLKQYVLKVDAGMSSLLIRLNTDENANVYLRHESPVEVANKQVVANVWATTAGGSATLSLAGDWLKSGTYYIAVEGTPPQRYEIKVVLK